MLRGFYADEDTRTPFLLQLVVSGTNIAAALSLTVGAPTDQVATRLALAYGIAYLVGAVTSLLVLSRRLGGLVDRDLATYLLRLAGACAVAAAAMLAGRWLLGLAGLTGASTGADAGEVVAVLALAGAAGVLGYLLAARALGLGEVRSLVGAVIRR